MVVEWVAGCVGGAHDLDVEAFVQGARAKGRRGQLRGDLVQDGGSLSGVHRENLDRTAGPADLLEKSDHEPGKHSGRQDGPLVCGQGGSGTELRIKA